MGLCLDHLSVLNLSSSSGSSQSEFPTEWNPWKPEAFLSMLQVPPRLTVLPSSLPPGSLTPGHLAGARGGWTRGALRASLRCRAVVQQWKCHCGFPFSVFLPEMNHWGKKKKIRERSTLFLWPASYPGTCVLPTVDIKAVKAYCQNNSVLTETGETRRAPWKTLNLAPPWWFAKFNFCNGLWWQRHSLFFQQELLNVWMTHSVGGRYNGSLRYPDLRVGRLCGRGGMGYTLSEIIHLASPSSGSPSFFSQKSLSGLVSG